MRYIHYQARLQALLLLFMLAGTLVACASQQSSTPEGTAPSVAVADTPLPSAPTAQGNAQVSTAVAMPTASEAAIPTAAEANTSVQPEGDAKAAILAATHALAQAGPYHATGTIVMQKTTNQIAIDVVPPDRFHYTMSTPDGPFEYIGIGGKSYMKAKGVWHPSPVSGDNLLQTAEPLREELVQQITDAKLAGTATVDGVATRMYTYTQHVDGFDSSATLWIDTARGLPVKIDSVSQTESGTAHGTETITYDPAITIDAPVR